MAKKKDDLDGTVEGLARDHFEKEKAAYEERTGQKVEFEPPVPVTRTPLPKGKPEPGAAPVSAPPKSAKAKKKPAPKKAEEPAATETAEGEGA